MNILLHLTIFLLITLIAYIGAKKTDYEEYFVALMIINIVYFIIIFFTTIFT
jgi:hypothetical protein